MTVIRRFRDIEWTFSNTAESATAVLLAVAIAAVVLAYTA